MLLSQLLGLTGGDRQRLLAEVAAHLGVGLSSPAALPHAPGSPAGLGKRARPGRAEPPPHSPPALPTGPTQMDETSPVAASHGEEEAK